MRRASIALLGWLFIAALVVGRSRAAESKELSSPHWLWSTAYHIPSEFTTEESGYFSLIEAANGRLYIGAAKYGDDAYLIEFDPASKQMRMVLDAEKEIGVDRKGFAAQAKIHTRNNLGASGRIYLGTKQGYPKEGEKRTDYLGGYPMVFDPSAGKTRVYGIPVPHQGVISIAPDESRHVAYLSTCSDERPIESSHFMILNLTTGKYRDLLDCRHMYAFIVVDHLGRAYHPMLGGQIARYDPRTDKLEQLRQTIDGKPPSEASLLAHKESHPINWEVSPDRKTLYAIAMSGNQLYAYDLTSESDTLAGRSLGPLIADASSTDCRAMCVASNGTVWAGVAAKTPRDGDLLRLVSYTPGEQAPVDRGPIAIGNPDYTTFTDAAGKPKPYHHGVDRRPDGVLFPRYSIMGICAARDGTIYATTLAPFTLHAIRFPTVAGIVTEYRHNSHADLLVGRLMETDTLDDRGQRSPLQLKSLYTDQRPENDTSRALAAKYHVRISDNVPSALTLSSDRLAVDGVLLVAEHGKYEESDTGQFRYPKRRLFSAIVDTFQRTGRRVPVFCDKHLADNWRDAKWIYETARQQKIPLMAGSTVPLTWRDPPIDVRRGAKLKEIVAVSFQRLDSYGFHALEAVQALAERRASGETGIARVQCLTGKAVWEAERSGRYDRRLLDEALSRLKDRPIPAGKRIEDLVTEPVLFAIDYRDGLRANIFTLNNAVSQWTAAWRYADSGETASTLFWTQELRPFGHFNLQLLGIEKMMQTGKPTWPVERTLLTSGALDALLTSKRDGGKPLDTPWLDVTYQSDWNWHKPPAPPPGRPLDGR
jgi:hypothetical protein